MTWVEPSADPLSPVEVEIFRGSRALVVAVALTCNTIITYSFFVVTLTHFFKQSRLVLPMLARNKAPLSDPSGFDVDVIVLNSPMTVGAYEDDLLKNRTRITQCCYVCQKMVWIVRQAHTNQPTRLEPCTTSRFELKLFYPSSKAPLDCEAELMLRQSRVFTTTKLHWPTRNFAA